MIKLSDLIEIAQEVMTRHGDLEVQVQHSTELYVSAEMVSIGLGFKKCGEPIAVVSHTSGDDDQIAVMEGGVTLFQGTKAELKDWMTKNGHYLHGIEHEAK
jgi:hypothetical protein